MTIRDHITEELGCYLLPMLKWVTLLHKYKLCKICPRGSEAPQRVLQRSDHLQDVDAACSFGRSDVWTVAGDAGGGVDPLCAGGGRLLPHPGLAAPDAGHGGRDLGAPGGFLMDRLYPSMRCVQMEQPAILYPKFVLIY